MVEALVDAVRRHSGDAAQSDDFTVVVARGRGVGA
jgi:serine phosphatase RsbU (regulator of sigma subunit)